MCICELLVWDSLSVVTCNKLFWTYSEHMLPCATRCYNTPLSMICVNDYISDIHRWQCLFTSDIEGDRMPNKTLIPTTSTWPMMVTIPTAMVHLMAVPHVHSILMTCLALGLQPSIGMTPKSSLTLPVPHHTNSTRWPRPHPVLTLTVVPQRASRHWIALCK